MQFRRGVVGIIYTKSHGELLFLILHRVVNWQGWEFVKGGVEDEDEMEALKREIREETGLKNIKIVKELCDVSYSYPEEHQQRTGYTGTTQKVFLVETYEKDITLSEEHDGFLWDHYKGTKEKITWEPQKNALDIAFQFLNK
jgi:8-oxo-dGTP pyrophosphatase MutT (NUDIX family)